MHASARALEVLVEVDAEELFSGERRRTNSGRITFVTADPQAVLPPFEPRDNEEDRRLFEEARRRHQERRSRKRQ